MFLLVGSVQAADASKLRRIAASTEAFASDGVRYAAWELGGRGGIVVLDTRTGRSSKLEADCALEGDAPAAAGRFLVSCAGAGQALLNARTKTVTALPQPPPHEYGEYGPIWTGVGLRYVVGKAGLHAQCNPPKRHESCLALYDIARATMSEVPESRVPDPDRFGAPSVCGALRKKVLVRTKFEELEGSGPLGPLRGGFSYESGLLAHPEQIGEAPVRHMRIDRCSGASTRVPVPREGPTGEPFPWNVELGGGFLSWDTGHSSDAYQEEAEEARSGLVKYGTLTSYRIGAREIQRWALPKLLLKVKGKEPRESPVGVFGYSAHAGRTVFWIAARGIDCEGRGCSDSERSDVYEASFRSR